MPLVSLVLWSYEDTLALFCAATLYKFSILINDVYLALLQLYYLGHQIVDERSVELSYGDPKL